MIDSFKKNFLPFATSCIAFINSIVLTYSSWRSLLSGDYGVVLPFVLYLVGGGFSFVVCGVNLYKICKERKKYIKLENKDKINEYLLKFIETGGRTVILSHDLSWITPRVQSRMTDKAQKGDLIIFIPEENEISKELSSKGADIRYFGDLSTDSANNIIKSRFTIVQWDTHSARITYPKETHRRHINYEFIEGDPTMDVAQDLIRLLVAKVPRST